MVKDNADGTITIRLEFLFFIFSGQSSRFFTIFCLFSRTVYMNILGKMKKQHNKSYALFSCRLYQAFFFCSFVKTKSHKFSLFSCSLLIVIQFFLFLYTYFCRCVFSLLCCIQKYEGNKIHDDEDDDDVDEIEPKRRRFLRYFNYYLQYYIICFCIDVFLLCLCVCMPIL